MKNTLVISFVLQYFFLVYHEAEQARKMSMQKIVFTISPDKKKKRTKREHEHEWMIDH